MPRSIWKGSISFGLVQIPVGLFTAEEGDDLSFHMLDKRTMTPIKYERVNAKTRKEVPWNQIVKGYEYDEGQYVLVTDEDFKNANVKATQTIDIAAFVDEKEISPLFFDKPYYLAPVKKGAKPYALLRETMRRSGRVGIATVVIRTRQHVAALLVVGDCLVLNLLRYEKELRDPNDLELPTGSLEKLGISKREIEMAEKLVEGLGERFDPSQFEDTYRKQLLAFIEKKAKSGETEAVNAPEAEDVPKGKGGAVDIMTLLKRSLEARSGPAKAKAAGARAGKSKSTQTAAKKSAHTAGAKPKKRAA